MVEQFVLDFLEILNYSLPPVSFSNNDRWHPSAVGWWKVNCDAAVISNSAALAFVVRDYSRLLVLARTKLIRVFLVYEVETKAIEWAASCANGKPCVTSLAFGRTPGGRRNLEISSNTW